MLYRKPRDVLIIAAEQNRKERDFWLRQLSGELNKTGFPQDFKETEKKAEIELTVFRLSEELCSLLRKLSRGSDYNLNVILIAGLVLLLNRYTGSHDIIVGSPIYRQEIEGEFINTVLALRNRVNEDISFKELLLQVRQTVTEAVENQNYPLELILNKLEITLSNAKYDSSPFDILILLENIHDREYVRHIRTNTLFSFLRTGESIEGKVEFNALSYVHSTIERIIVHFKQLLRQVLSDPDARLSDVDVLTEEEKRQLLFDFNDTARSYPKDKTIPELFEVQADKFPDKIALAGPTYSGREHGSAAREQIICLTYRQLHHAAGRLARLLIQKGVKPGTIVGLSVERSVEMIFGILAILKAKGAYMPVDPRYPFIRQAYMFRDSDIGLLLTARCLYDETAALSSLKLETVFIEEDSGAGAFSHPDESLISHPLFNSAGEPAYIMYTSGSTGKAKGVLVEHRNVVRLVKNTDFIELNTGTRILLTGAPVFDATTFEIWGALLNGGTLFLVKNDVILNAGELGGVLLKNEINVMWLTSPLFNQLMQQDETIFSRLRYLLVGGDVLSPYFINRCREKNKGLKIINGYGPTENTTFSTTYLIDKEFRENIPIGKPIANSTVYILGGNSKLQIPGVLGELVVGGDGVSRGYLNDPELTAEKFISGEGSDLLYKTGDLARWLPDGNIEYNGRIDYQVKIRGFRIEPEEVENHLLNQKNVKEAVVTVRGGDGEKYLCAYIVGDIEETTALRKSLAEKVPDYMIPAYFILLDKMPLTGNGKIDRRSLPEPGMLTMEGYAAPRDRVERKLVKIWSKLLAVKQERIGIDDNFFELGGHSLKLMLLISQIQEEFGLKLPLNLVFTAPTIRELAVSMREAEIEPVSVFNPVEKKEYYLLSSAQKRFYVLQFMEKENTSYNVQGVVSLSGEIERKRLEKTFHKLIDRHETLRTAFRMVGGKVVQVINEKVKFRVEYYFAEQGGIKPGENREKGLPVSEILRNFIRPFDLSQAPLIRVGLITTGERQGILSVDMSHIIADGTSLDILVKEFFYLYDTNGEGELPPFRLTYKDYSGWQNAARQTEAFARQENWWLKQFPPTAVDKIPRLNLPLDYKRSSIQASEGGVITFAITGDETTAIKKMVTERDVTLFIIILALSSLLLSKICHQEDIIVGSPVVNRTYTDLTAIVGNFLNTLVLRNYPRREKKFSEFLKEVGDHTMEAFRNRDYPYEDLVERLLTQRDSSRNSLFDVLVVLRNTDIGLSYLPEPETDAPLKLSTTPYLPDYNRSPFDIAILCADAGETIEFNIYYRTTLFKKETIGRLVDNFREILTIVLTDIDTKIGDITISTDFVLAAADREQEGMGDFGF